MSGLEKEMEAITEEELSDVDMSLSEPGLVEVYAAERLQQVVNYQKMSMLKRAVAASITANESVGNEKEVKKFQEQSEEITKQMKFCARFVKLIDTENPKAKDRMIAISKRTA